MTSRPCPDCGREQCTCPVDGYWAEVTRRVTCAALLAFAACHPQPPQPLPGEGVCGRFCVLLDRLNCVGQDSPGQDEIPGNEDDVPCQRVCEDILATGTYRPKPGDACLDTATTCGAAEACVLGP